MGLTLVYEMSTRLSSLPLPFLRKQEITVHAFTRGERHCALDMEAPWRRLSMFLLGLLVCGAAMPVLAGLCCLGAGLVCEVL